MMQAGTTHHPWYPSSIPLLKVLVPELSAGAAAIVVSRPFAVVRVGASHIALQAVAAPVSMNINK